MTNNDRAAGLRLVGRLYRGGILGHAADADLLDRFLLGGEPAELAFSALVERHGPMVLRTCRALLGDPHDAHDAFQATFLVLVRRARSLRVGETLGPWLYSVASRVTAGVRTAEARRRAHERASGGTALHRSEDPDRDDLASAVREELARLPDRYRAPLVLCHLDGLTHDQAASRLGWPVGTVRSRLARGRDRLRSRLARRGLAPTAGLIAPRLQLDNPAAALPISLVATTVGAALQLAANGPGAASALAPASARSLAEGVVNRMMILARLKHGMAALVSVACLLAVAAPTARRPVVADDPKPPAAPKVVAGLPSSTPATPIPKPSETAVRIRIKHSSGAEVVGSGTIIRSDAEESIVLSCAHVFMDAGGPPDPAEFRSPIEVDVFDGKPPGPSPAPVHLTGTYVGRAIDYEPKLGVGLIRISPGRVLPGSPVVPGRWEPRAQMRMMAIGCSDGREPTGWDTTVTRRVVRMMPTSDKPMAMIECTIAPAQGRSGGGLFTDDGYLAGVCGYADPDERTGLYAAPEAIRTILDRNGLGSQVRSEGPVIAPFAVANIDRLIETAEERLKAGEAWSALVPIDEIESVLRDERARHRAQIRRIDTSYRDRVSRLRLDANSRLRQPIPVLAPIPPEPVPKADHERRLEEVERKLDRVLKALEGLKPEDDR